MPNEHDSLNKIKQKDVTIWQIVTETDFLVKGLQPFDFPQPGEANK